ncbi:MAG: hypothetical protein AAB576_10050, partial [Elusimicrobiota bacterium]
GGTREAVEDGLAGLLFDPQDPEDEARRLGKLLLNPGLAAALGKSAREAAEARYSIVSTAERCLKLY